MLLYMQALLTQVAPTAACNRHHSLSKQLCRWMLIEIDRRPSNEFRVTQQMIADMLGVRREGVTEAAGKLHDAGLIHHSRDVSRCSIARVWKGVLVSAMTSSSASSTGCCRAYVRRKKCAEFAGPSGEIGVRICE
jgi:hypothetical protein